MTKPANIVVITSKYNEQVTHRLYQSACDVWQSHFKQPEKPVSFWVPGAVELPLTAKWAIEKLAPQAVVCLGAVIRGETAHFDFVCQQVSHGCMEISLKTGVPVIFGVLTVDTFDQALQRTGGAAGDHGSHAMHSAIDMLANKTFMERMKGE